MSERLPPPTDRAHRFRPRDAKVADPQASATGNGRYGIKVHVGRRVYRRLLYARDEPLWPLLPVRSCFGGLAIYNASRLASRGRCGYEAPRSTDCEHANLHSCLARQPRGFRLFLHPQMHLPAPPITQPGAAPLTDHEELPSDLPPDLDPEAVRLSAMRWFEFNARQLLAGRDRPDAANALLLALEMWRAALLGSPRTQPHLSTAKQLAVSALENMSDALARSCDAAAVRGRPAPKTCAKHVSRKEAAGQVGLKPQAGFLLDFKPLSPVLTRVEGLAMSRPTDEDAGLG